jgi:hypothetical protein
MNGVSCFYKSKFILLIIILVTTIVIITLTLT